MKQFINRSRLLINVVCYNLSALLKGELGLFGFFKSLRKQAIISSFFRDAKHIKVGKKLFLDPFIPYFPSPYFNRLLANNSVDTFPLKPIHGQINITDKCPCNCVHCHVGKTQAHKMTQAKIFEIIDDMFKLHFPLVVFVGGEPLSRFDDLCLFIKRASKFMDTRIFTSGVSATPEKLRELKEAGLNGICVSLDHYLEDIHNNIRRNKVAYKSACSTVQHSLKLQLYVSIVCCTTPRMVQSGEIFKMVEFAESLGAHSIQINEIRPVGNAKGEENSHLYLTEQDKQILIKYYKEHNSDRKKKIAVVMPWYNERPDRFGCTATSGQHAYVDAQGNVSPCVLLKTSVGNVNDQNFYDIWKHFCDHCGHPVKECIVNHFNNIITEDDVLPLAAEKTMSVWKDMCAIDSTEIFKKIQGKTKKSEDKSLVPIEKDHPFEKKYNLRLVHNKDFFTKENHWVPRLLGVNYFTFGKTLYCDRKMTSIPQHEFLHIVQFCKNGVVRVIFHYTYHLFKNYLHSFDFKAAFEEIPFEKEARLYEDVTRGDQP